MNNNIGRRIDGRYEITELIGIGGMAEVYKAIDVMENKTVAVKILKAEFSQNEEFKRRFRNESKAIAVLSHPNIVKVYDVGFNDDIQYIVMEYIDGITLKEFMEQQGALRWKDAVHFTIQILRALQHAHDRGIVHRDIKPQNTMLFTDGTIKVMDFGIARFSREEGKTLNDKTIGSVHYISPEQARGDITDERTDIYSVGAMLYEMLTGQKPFEADTPVAVALMHMHDDPVMPRQINPSIPVALEEIIMCAMQKNVNQRYQSASSMINDIDAFKMNPNIIFGYKFNPQPVNDEKTMMFNPINGRNNLNSGYNNNNTFASNGENQYMDSDAPNNEFMDDEEPQKKSYLFPILGAVTVGVVVIAVIVMCIVLIGNGKDKNTNMLEVPDVTNQTLAEMQDRYKDFNFEVTEEFSDTVEAGKIIEQDPQSGTKALKGSTIKVKVSKGPEQISVPDVTGKTKDEAIKMLSDAGLSNVTTENVTDTNDTGIAKGSVLFTSPPANTKVNPGDKITISVSLGASSLTTTVPDLYGCDEETARNKLKNVNLEIDVQHQDSDVEKDKVCNQTPQKSSKVAQGSKVTVYLSNGQQDSSQQDNNQQDSSQQDSSQQDNNQTEKTVTASGQIIVGYKTPYDTQFIVAVGVYVVNYNFVPNNNSVTFEITGKFKKGDTLPVSIINKTTNKKDKYGDATFDGEKTFQISGDSNVFKNLDTAPNT